MSYSAVLITCLSVFYIQIIQLLLQQPWFSNAVAYEAISRALLHARDEGVREMLLRRQQECL